MPILIRRVGQLMMLIWILDQRIFRRKPNLLQLWIKLQQIQFGLYVCYLLQKRTKKPTVEFLKTVLLEIKDT
jgi:hypothetical protein